MDISIILIILQLILLEGLLSIDNAAVLGTLVSKLPKDEPIPWPRSLQGMEKSCRKPLGTSAPRR